MPIYLVQSSILCRTWPHFTSVVQVGLCNHLSDKAPCIANIHKQPSRSPSSSLKPVVFCRLGCEYSNTYFTSSMADEEHRSYPTKDAPLFHTGAGVSLMSAIVMVVTGAGLSMYVLRANRKKRDFMSNAGIDHQVDIESLSSF